MSKHANVFSVTAADVADVMGVEVKDVPENALDHVISKLDNDDYLIEQFNISIGDALESYDGKVSNG